MGEKVTVVLPYWQDLETYLLGQKKSVQGKKVSDYRVLSKSLDARAKRTRAKEKGTHEPRFVYRLELPPFDDFAGHWESFDERSREMEQRLKAAPRPVIVGAGPAGLFCALRLAELGLKPIVLERGGHGRSRMVNIARFWRYGELNPEDNVCFGAGGAGLFSDGKLKTRIKSPLIHYVMERLVDLGAPESIKTYRDPHLGSNKMRALIDKLVEYLEHLGCQISFSTKVVDFVMKDSAVSGVVLESGETLASPWVVLATGHSARDIYKLMARYDVQAELKPFSVGARLEHSSQSITSMQYGAFYSDIEKELGAARYALSHHNPDSKRGTYSFCMCPGGYVLSAGTESSGIVTNGMSNFSKNSRWSNGAMVTTVNPEHDFQNRKILAGMEFQKVIEERCKEATQSSRALPALSVQEFLEGKIRDSLKLEKTSCPSGLAKAPLYELLPPFIVDHLREALLSFDRKIPGFIKGGHMAPQLVAPETRTSSPMRILRDPTGLESLSHRGLFPCGEGAGYAGGITSAAVDGVKVAHQLFERALL